MTGFARREAQEDWGTLAWEVRSVNHRYLEVSWRLPEEFRALEPQFRRIVGDHLKRGKIECGLRLRWSDAVQPPLRLNRTLLMQLADATKETAEHFPEPQLNGYWK